MLESLESLGSLAGLYAEAVVRGRMTTTRETYPSQAFLEALETHGDWAVRRREEE